ncbi:hypothetical protein HanPSC8_Chr09g0385881 [Helianthus annuus]|nr:hypothetical protein HanPSC8_Chr09g0385881 [Helianthus annuus]
MGSDEETKTGEEASQQINNNTPQQPFDLNDYTIIKEGEAEILMHKKTKSFIIKPRFVCLYLIYQYVVVK